MNLNQKQVDALLNIMEYEQTHDPKEFKPGVELEWCPSCTSHYEDPAAKGIDRGEVPLK